MESLAGIEPNAAALGQATPQSGAEWGPGAVDEMLGQAPPAAGLSLESAPPPPRSMRAREAAPPPKSHRSHRGVVVSSAILVYCHETFMKPGFRKAVCAQNNVNRTTLNSALNVLKKDHEMRTVKQAKVAARDDPGCADHAAALLELEPYKELWPQTLRNPAAATLPAKSGKNGAANYLGSGVCQAEYLRVFDLTVCTLNPNP